MINSRRYAAVFGLSIFVLSTANADDWPQWLGPQRDGIWRETGILESFPKEGPKVLWRAKVSGGYGGASVAAGKVYLMDYVTDADNKGEIFERPNFKGQERVLCFSADKGEKLWEHKYDCAYTISFPNGPRVTPTIADGKVYTVGAEGNMFCLDADTGKVIWSKDFKTDYGAKTPIWGFCGHPLVDGKKVICIVGGENACAVAFNKDTGKEIWRSLNASEPGYSCPSIIEAGGVRQLLIWHATSINSLNPETGAKYWAVLLSPEYKMSIMAPQQAGEYLFAAGIRDKAVLLKLASDTPTVTEVWRGKKGNALYPVNMTPHIDKGTIYGVTESGPLVAVDLKTGDRKWETAEPVTGKDPKKADSATAFLIKNGDRYFIFNERGELVIAKLTPEKYEEIDRAKIIQPTNKAFGRDVVWNNPAFANKCMFVRNDKEIVCVSLAK